MASASHNQESEATKAVTSAMSNEALETFYQGGAPFVGGDAQKWAVLKDNLSPCPDLRTR